MTYISCSGEDYRFLGIISSDYLEDEMSYFKDRVEKDIDKRVSLLYVYDGSNKRQDLEYLISYHELEFDKSPDKYKRRPFDMDYLVDSRGVDKERFLLDLEEHMKASDPRDDNLIYMTIDGVWTAGDKEEVGEFYGKLKDLGRKYNHRFIIRYILNELNRGYIHGMMLEHKYVLLRRKDGLRTYSSRDLLSQSMATFSYYSEIEEKYEEEMMRVEHLKSMGELTEGIVHDVNNLLTTVLGCLELIEFNGLKENNQEYMDTIYKSVEEGSGIMSRVLSHMRGTKDSQKDQHLLDDIVEFCVDMSYIKLKNLGCDGQIKTSVVLDSNSYIYVNEYDIRQAILNIIFNAVDAMPDGGELRISTSKKGDQALLRISDTGLGMSPGTLDRIFDAYYTTKGELGTGIGLNMTKKICDSHNVGIDVLSEKGRGTEFRLSFPLLEEGEEEDDTIKKC